jgi:hypothetical protein
MSTQSNTEADETDSPKTTRITFHNPEQGFLPQMYKGRDTEAVKHFEAAQYIKDEIGVARTRVFGELAVGIKRLEQKDDPDKLLKVCNKLTTPGIEFTDGQHIDVEEE